MSKKITIAIDGFSSTGKSTIARQLANKLNYIYVDTGAMYRAVTLYAYQNDYIKDNNINKTSLIEDLDNIKLHFVLNPETGIAEIHLNNKNVEKYIRSIKISQWVSKIAAISEVRKKLVREQQAMGKNKGIVMDGRDIGTVVFPEAELKIFMTASAEKRATRRYEELKQKGGSVSYEDVLQNVIERDHIDSTRKDSPLTVAKEAIEIDNSNMTIDEQFDKIINLVHKIIN